MEARIEALELSVAHLQNNINSETIKQAVLETIKSEIDDLLAGTLTVSCIKGELERRNKREKLDIEEIMKGNKSTQLGIQKLSEKLISFNDDLKDLKIEVNDISHELKHKALDIDLQRIESSIQSLCPMSYAYLLDAEIRTLAKQEELNLTLQALNDLKKTVEFDCFSKAGANEEFLRIEKAFEIEFSQYATVKNLNEAFGSLKNGYEEVARLNKETKEMLIKETEHLREVINYNKKDTQEKITKLNVEIVRELDNKSSRSELKSFEIEITQNIQSFREEIKGFARSLKAYEAELRRFDEVLLQKASKVDIKDLLKKVSFLSQYPNVELTLNDLTQNVEILFQHKESLLITIHQLEEELENLKKGIEKKISNNHEMKLFKQALYDLQFTLTDKADTIDVLKYLDEKATIADLNNSNASIDALHKQLKLIAVHLTALQRILSDPYKLKGPERSKKEYFYKMTQRLVDYIVASKVITNNSAPIPEDLKAFFKLNESIKLSESVKVNDSIKLNETVRPPEPTQTAPTPKRKFSFHRRFSSLDTF
ncbi:unnamed protein product [Blepharisma stoltei]|uniref:Uncharacterized protein n=1 Tax=Blepharisma stoltei TaxID=1481888 RepID=A0AAU9J3J8_9CILI|nr:unnamed protein product [Blepharisma stoltei]